MVSLVTHISATISDLCFFVFTAESTLPPTIFDDIHAWVANRDEAEGDGGVASACGWNHSEALGADGGVGGFGAVGVLAGV